MTEKRCFLHLYLVLRRRLLLPSVSVGHAQPVPDAKKKTAEAVFGTAGEVATEAQTRRTRSRGYRRDYFAGAGAAGTASAAFVASAFTLALLAL